ncbi:uncharacterized protein LOC119279137 [Triticum dicoccoides]|uniref:uncharacterized protein LOC119279137 n=1 Tax=Triticum dicoccoides TaxID=85692 RepID=UPI00188FA43F|nr:uncharacterized protein LOC119279137 [Triticum dicoccoides]
MENRRWMPKGEAIASSATPFVHFYLLILIVVLLAPRLGGSSQYTGYTRGGKHFVISSSDAQRPPPPTSCSTISLFKHGGGMARPDSSFISSGDGGIARNLPVLHQLSPCSPLNTSTLARRDFLRRSGSLGHPHSRLLNSGATIPTTAIPFPTLRGASEFHVVVGYGTPAQKLAVSFDSTLGATHAWHHRWATSTPATTSLV